ncbi:hypothetical protein Hanom_Chr14g01249761 [Helianthus anomalus]
MMSMNSGYKTKQEENHKNLVHNFYPGAHLIFHTIYNMTIMPFHNYTNDITRHTTQTRR